jgi:hypothetical protein
LGGISDIAVNAALAIIEGAEPRNEVEAFYGKWLLAAARADVLMKKALNDPVFGKQIDRVCNLCTRLLLDRDVSPYAASGKSRQFRCGRRLRNLGVVPAWLKRDFSPSLANVTRWLSRLLSPFVR